MGIYDLPATVAPAVSGLYIAGETEPASLMLLALTVFFLHMSANALNDIADYEPDRINAPDRLLVRGVLSSQQVGVLSTVLMLIGLLFAWMLDWLLFTAAATLGLILWMAYNYGARLKDRPLGSLIYLSMSTSAVPFIGGFIVMRNLNMVSVALAFFLAVFTGAIVIDSLKDIRGDIYANKRTVAVLLGEERARRFVTALLLIPILAYPLLWLVFGFSQIYLLYVTIPISLRLLIGSMLLFRREIDTPRILTRLLIVVDFTILALAKPEYGLL
ncbi:MAG: UbiA family prenyltransferase [Nitrososphaerales archaeon]